MFIPISSRLIAIAFFFDYYWYKEYHIVCIYSVAYCLFSPTWLHPNSHSSNIAFFWLSIKWKKFIETNFNKLLSNSIQYCILWDSTNHFWHLYQYFPNIFYRYVGLTGHVVGGEKGFIDVWNVPQRRYRLVVTTCSMIFILPRRGYPPQSRSHRG